MGVKVLSLVFQNDMVFVLCVCDLCKIYDNGIQVLKGVFLEVVLGDFFVLFGFNGVGKLILIGIISFLVNFSEGQVEVFGSDLVCNCSVIMCLIGLVLQEINFNLFEKFFDILVNYVGFYGVLCEEVEKCVEEELKCVYLWEKVQVMSCMLFGGMKCWLMIVCVMMICSWLLILDEFIVGVDIEICCDMWCVLKEINGVGIMIIFIIYYLEEVEYLCCYLVIINYGQIVEQGLMCILLVKLDVEGFLLDIDGDLLVQLLVIEGVMLIVLDLYMLDIDMLCVMDFNCVFVMFNEFGICVCLMCIKSNCLEELFVCFIGNMEKFV